MNSNIQMVFLVSKEEGHTSSLTRCVIIGKLGQRKQLRPIVLLIVAVSVEVLLEGLIDLLSLPILFKMISQSEVKLHSEGCAEAVEEVRDKL